MTPELAALLDGPVAERFGRPTIGDEPRMEMRLTCGGWDWFDDEYLDDMSPGIAQPIAAALWLAHLIGVCGSKHYGISMANLVPGWECHLGYGFCKASDVYAQPTALEALAHAMLAVPENKP